MSRAFGPLPLILLWALPLLLGLWFALEGLLDAQAWGALLQHPQLWPGLVLSLATAGLSVLLALLLALIILSGLHGTRAWCWIQGLSAAGLSLPHLSFAIGLGFLIMPSGLLARLIAGGTAPPQWVSVHDPYGLALVAALTLKEIPFLVALGWGALSQGDAARAIADQGRAARSLGHGAGSVWLRIVQPQLLRSLSWPVMIVFAYGASAVDLAIAIGPTQPPTLAAVIWNDLNNADTAINARGLAGALLLTGAVAIMIALASSGGRLLRRRLRDFNAAGPSLMAAPYGRAAVLGSIIALSYLAVVMILLLMSIALRWPFPALLPVSFGDKAWITLLQNPEALWTSLAMAVAAGAAALFLAVLWLESVGQTFDKWLIGACLVSLVLPQVVITAGQYRLYLMLGLTGTYTAVFLAHLTPVLAYLMIVLSGPYRAFDQRYVRAASSLGAPRWRSWLAVKMPLLRAPLLTAAAVGFAVSLVQYVPAALMGAGRVTTLPVEAVTLTSGGDRALTAAYALALALPALLAFLLAGMLGRPRWR
jgi:putative thiamine transport system permease protein